jgi:tetratricopeptide (TPR) repeat protein
LGQQTRAGRARLLTGLIRIINGNMEGAFTALKDAVNLGEKDPLLWINLGTLCYHQGNYTQAGKYFLEGIKVTDKIPHPYVGLGTILRLDGEFDKAEEQFLYALKIDPKYSPALIGLANVQWEKERFEESLSLLQKALILEKDNSTALISVAYIAFTVRDFDNCVGFCRQILQVTKEDKVKSDFALLLFASLCAASIRFAKDRNFGEAENRFHNACTIFSNLNVEEAEEMMAFYFFALANYVESDLWNKMLDFSHSAGLLNLSRILKLHHLAIKAKYSPNKRTEIERLFPEERGIFEEIMAELNQ